MRGIGALLVPVMGVMVEQAAARAKGDEKVQACIDRYIDAAKYPRKKKKRIRRQANKEYRFWMAINKWHDNFFNI